MAINLKQKSTLYCPDCAFPIDYSETQHNCMITMNDNVRKYFEQQNYYGEQVREINQISREIKDEINEIEALEDEIRALQQEIMDKKKETKRKEVEIERVLGPQALKPIKDQFDVQYKSSQSQSSFRY